MKPSVSILAVFVALIFPNLSFGQTAPNLGTASSYALFTADGAFTNTGASTVTGNIGTNVGALTGFPPGTLIGESHVADGASLQAANDVTAANNQLTAATCGPNIGNSLGGLTLTPGVYCQSGPALATDLTGVLTLDGGGNQDAVFIIKLSGAFSTATGSSIALIGNASFANVYFQVNGAVNMGVSSVFLGTVIANGAISLLTGATLQGRGLSIAGAINLDANKVNTPSALPVSLVSFNVQKEAQTAALSWSTAEEVNSDRFEVEHSLNGKNWQKVGSVAAKGNSKNTQWYSFTDNNPANGSNLYRLRIVDKDGTFEITRAKSLTFDIAIETVMYPNPVAERLLLKTGDLGQIRRVELYNTSGKSVLESETVTASGIDVKGLPTGLYVVKVTRTNGSTDTFKIVKQ